jgi:hypothetical protein
MKYLIHTTLVVFWANCVHYAMNALEQQGYDLLLVAVIFLCGVIACSQAFILLTEAEEIVCY